MIRLATAVPHPVARVCFVCTGNICRSPMADVVLRRMVVGTVLADPGPGRGALGISSAGTTGWHTGDPMDPRARAALEHRGYRDHGHRARSFDPAWLEGADLVVCMDRGHRQSLVGLVRSLFGDDRFEERLVMLRQFDRRAGGAVDVPDPYYGDESHFAACLAMVESGCRGLVDHLVRASG